MKKVNNCPVCKCEMWLPDELCDAALKSAKIGFHCAYGHHQHFSEECIKAYWTKPVVTKNQKPQDSTDNIIQFRSKSCEGAQSIKT